MNQIRILVADDERIERAILCKKLSSEFGDGYEWIQAGNGREALRIFEEEKNISVAILDIAMPGLNGIQVAEKIRACDKACVLVFLTAYSDFHYARQAIRLQALDYLTKPYQDDELFSVMEEAIHQAGLRQETGKAILSPPSSAETPIEDTDVPITRTATRKIHDFISENYMHEISMQDAARYMNYSDSYFCKLFKQGFGTNFTTYLTTYRMQEAVRLLKTTNLPVHEISLRTGYADSNYFSKVFKRLHGMVPRDFRRNAKESVRN